MWSGGILLKVSELGFLNSLIIPIVPSYVPSLAGRVRVGLHLPLPRYHIIPHPYTTLNEESLYVGHQSLSCHTIAPRQRGHSERQ